MKEIDIKTCSLEDIREFDYSTTFDVKKYRESSKTPKDHIHGFVTWFDVTFVSNWPECAEVDPVVLSTSPFESPATHWQQDCFLMGERISIGDINEIECTMQARQHRQWHRHYEVAFKFVVGDHQYSKDFVL